MFQKALDFVYEKGYKDALMLSTLLLYWEVSRLLTETKSKPICIYDEDLIDNLGYQGAISLLKISGYLSKIS